MVEVKDNLQAAAHNVYGELSVGEVSRRSGISVSTLHFYEAQGLIKSRRTKGNQRRFPKTILRVLAIIRIAQQTGIALSVIRERIALLPDDRPLTTGDWAQLSTTWRDELDERIALLSTLRDNLTSCIGCGCLSVADCPLRNPGDIAAEFGPGARAFDIK